MAAPSNVRIRPIERAELGKLLHIFAEAIPHRQLSRSIYLAPGAEAFLGALLDHRELQAAEELWGVELEGQGLVAGAHTRSLGEYNHLNSYAVRPAFQRQGFGARMMTHWHELARGRRARALSLDVDLENEGARRHYAAFQFVESGRMHEYRLKGPLAVLEGGGVQLHDWPLAQAAFATYGFGRFALSAGPERCSVDLRVDAFRLSSTDPRFLAALQQIDARRAIFVRTSAALDAPQWSLSGTLVRMVKELG